MPGDVWVVVGVLAASSIGCATVRGRSETITVVSEPSGADVVAVCGTTHLTAVTPGDLIVSRRMPDCEVTIRKEGFSDAHAFLERGVERWFWVDLVGVPLAAAGLMNTALEDDTEKRQGYTIALLAITPGIIDLATRNFYDHDPKEVKVILQPLVGVR